MLHDRALRPAKVGVTKGGPKEEAPAAGSPGNTPESGTYEPKAGEPGATFDEEL
jgi:hypothetical protein